MWTTGNCKFLWSLTEKISMLINEISNWSNITINSILKENPWGKGKIISETKLYNGAEIL